MALSSYAELKAALEAWEAQEDIAAIVDDIIDLAEADHARDLRVREMVVASGETAFTGGDTLPIPTGWIENLSFRRASTVNPVELEYRSAPDFFSMDWTKHGGPPRFYTIQGTNFVIAPNPEPTSAYHLDYYAKPTPLDDQNPTNWLLQKAPGAYLYGALRHAEPYLVNDERVTWEVLYQREIEALQRVDARAKYRPGSRMRGTDPAQESYRYF